VFARSAVFGPDSSLPAGPRLPRLVQTAWFVARPIECLERCHRRFGDYFTLRLIGLGTTVFVADPAGIKAIFTGDPKILHAGEGNAILEPLLGAKSVLLLDEQAHIRKRRLMLPAFHGERMQSYASLIEEITLDEINRWPIGEPFPIRARMQAITLDVIMRAVFGIVDADRLAALRPRVARLVKMSMGPGAALLPFVGRSRSTSRWTPWARFQRAVESVDEILFAEIAARRSSARIDERSDILSLLVQATDAEGRGMSDQELRDELVTLLLAGHETTATSGAWAVELLLRNPKAHKRFRESFLGGERAYLDAVIMETLRLRPAIPAVGRKLTAPLTLAGHELPKGTNVSPCIYLVHRRPDLYPEPDSFQPERFLPNAPNSSEWFPFGGGTRRCVGASFATLELRIVLSTILSSTNLAPADKVPDNVERRAVVLVPKRGVRVVRLPANEPSTAPCG
jgi:cytochrome P450